MVRTWCDGAFAAARDLWDVFRTRVCVALCLSLVCLLGDGVSLMWVCGRGVCTFPWSRVLGGVCLFCVVLRCAAKSEVNAISFSARGVDGWVQGAGWGQGWHIGHFVSVARPRASCTHTAPTLDGP